MKLYAKVELENKKSVEELARELYEIGNIDGLFKMKGHQVELEVTTEETNRIMAAIIHGNRIKEMHICENENSFFNIEAFNKNETTKLAEPEIVKKDELKESEPRSDKKSKKEFSRISELSDLAENSSSFDEFIDSVVKWLEIKGNRIEYFKTIVKKATKMEKIVLKQLEPGENNSRFKYVSDCIKAKLGSDYTFLKLIKIMINYQSYFSKETNTEAEKKTKVTMNCMPEIPSFEEFLANIDPKKTVEEKVESILNEMGLEQIDAKEKEGILLIANTAVRIEDMTSSNIFSVIPQDFIITQEMIFSRLINDFVGKYYKVHKKIKVFDFLKDLQIVVMKEI